MGAGSPRLCWKTTSPLLSPPNVSPGRPTHGIPVTGQVAHGYRVIEQGWPWSCSTTQSPGHPLKLFSPGLLQAQVTLLVGRYLAEHPKLAGCSWHGLSCEIRGRGDLQAAETVAPHQKRVSLKEDGVHFWPSAQAYHEPVDLLLEAQRETCREGRKAPGSQDTPVSIPCPCSWCYGHSPLPHKLLQERSHVNVGCLSTAEGQVASPSWNKARWINPCKGFGKV